MHIMRSGRMVGLGGAMFVLLAGLSGCSSSPSAPDAPARVRVPVGPPVTPSSGVAGESAATTAVPLATTSSAGGSLRGKAPRVPIVPGIREEAAPPPPGSGPRVERTEETGTGAGDTVDPAGVVSAPAVRRPPVPVSALAGLRAPVRWSWPADGEVIRRFGLVGQQQNDGIEIRTRAGAPVVAAADGVVVYEGDLASGLGKVVMVRHGGGYATTYANNSEVVATHGQSVRAGDKLALSSGTLAFEIRRGTVPEDPLKYLMAAGRRTR